MMSLRGWLLIANKSRDLSMMLSFKLMGFFVFLCLQIFLSLISGKATYISFYVTLCITVSSLSLYLFRNVILYTIVSIELYYH